MITHTFRVTMLIQVKDDPEETDNTPKTKAADLAADLPAMISYESSVLHVELASEVVS